MQSVLISSAPAELVDRLADLAELGFDGLFLHHVGVDQRDFIETVGEHVLPALAQGQSSRTLAGPETSGGRTPSFDCLDVETFQDSDGDGISDFAGLARRDDYLAGLGITCIWLMPFYPSPNRGDGYDITDY